MEDWPTTFRADVQTYASGPMPTDHFGHIFGYYVSEKRVGKCIFDRPAHEVRQIRPFQCIKYVTKTLEILSYRLDAFSISVSSELTRVHVVILP